jgi:TRAP-type uncharacterized transport system substrate-binding protein
MKFWVLAPRPFGRNAVLMFRSMPPRLIVMATGAEGTRYYDVGERYRASLARANVEVRLVSTTGSVENLAMPLNPHAGASVALIEGGIILSASASSGSIRETWSRRKSFCPGETGVAQAACGGTP